MKEVSLSEEEFDRISQISDRVSMPNDGYIPSDDDIYEYIQRFPERYTKYLIWYSGHRPRPRTEDEKRRLKNISKLTNNAIKIE